MLRTAFKGITSSIRAKLLLVMTALVLGSLLSYLVLALQLFNKDKKVDIYENNLFLVKTLGSEIEEKLVSPLRTMRLIAYQVGRGEGGSVTPQILFKENSSLVELRIYSSHDLATAKIALQNDAFLKEYQLAPNYFDGLRERFKVEPAALSQEKLKILNASLPSGAPLLYVGMALENTGADGGTLFLTAFIRQESFLKLFSESPVYTLSLVDPYGNFLVHSDPKKVLSGQAQFSDPVVSAITHDQSLDSGTKEITGPEGSVIASFARLNVGGLILVSQISKAKAYLSSQILIEKSIVVALIIIFSAIIVSILFSRRLTLTLKRLYQATLKVADGDFNIDVRVDSKDEVGSLATSFIKMTGEIKRLLLATADKARMEKELETAKLVQENLFPDNLFAKGIFEAAAAFAPASECSGDWWTTIDFGDQVAILVGDATGHGAPAALITAAAQSCCTTLKKIKEQDPSFEITSKKLMENLNSSIYYAGRASIKMTFFCGMINLQTGAMSYTNASHDMPLYVKRDNDGVVEIDSFTGEPDPILGADPASTFRQHEVQLNKGDFIVWYTDGLIEGRNPKGEEWGENRMARLVAKQDSGTAAELRDTIIQKARAFYEGFPQDDDITLIVGKIR